MITDPTTGRQHDATGGIEKIIATHEIDDDGDGRAFTRYGYDVIVNGERHCATIGCLTQEQLQRELDEFLAKVQEGRL